MEFLDVIKNRKKISRFTSQPIPDEVLHEILEAGHLVHSQQIDQHWYFGVIKDAELKQKLADSAGGQDWIATAPVIIAYCSYLPQDQVSSEHKIRFGKDLCAYYGEYEEYQKLDSFWESSNPLIPGEHIVLAAINHGLDACWVGNLDTLQASTALNLPYDLKCLFLMPLGYAKDSQDLPKRKSYREIVFYDHWSK
ncbi:MAG: nitroreductase family protein [Candidatus Cloacimonadales bacterium]